MAKCRPGKAERALLKAQWTIVREARKELIQSNLTGPRPEPTGIRPVNLAARMVHGLYREQVTKEGFRKGTKDFTPKLSKGGFASDRTPVAPKTGTLARDGVTILRKMPELKRPWYVTLDPVK